MRSHSNWLPYWSDNSRCPGAHWIADSVAMGAVPDPDRKHSAPVIISAILLLVENRLHQLGHVLRGED